MPRTLLLLAIAIALAAGEAAAPVLVPLSVFAIAAGDQVSIDGKVSPADAAGLSLPPGRAVPVEWTANGQKQSLPITVVTTTTGDLTPAWHKDGPRQEGNQQVVVGTGTMASVWMAYDRALNDARTQAARNSPATTTSIEERTVTQPNGSVLKERSIRSSTTRATTVISQTRDIVILVHSDPAQSRPVTCWVRIAASVTIDPPRPETPAQRQAREDADKAFEALNRKLAEELAKPAAPGATGTSERGEAKDQAAEQAAVREAEEAAKRKAADPAR